MRKEISTNNTNKSIDFKVPREIFIIVITLIGGIYLLFNVIYKLLLLGIYDQQELHQIASQKIGLNYGVGFISGYICTFISFWKIDTLKSNL